MVPLLPPSSPHRDCSWQFYLQQTLTPSFLFYSPWWVSRSSSFEPGSQLLAFRSRPSIRWSLSPPCQRGLEVCWSPFSDSPPPNLMAHIAWLVNSERMGWPHLRICSFCWSSVFEYWGYIREGCWYFHRRPSCFYRSVWCHFVRTLYCSFEVFSTLASSSCETTGWNHLNTFIIYLLNW